MAALVTAISAAHATSVIDRCIRSMEEYGARAAPARAAADASTQRAEPDEVAREHRRRTLQVSCSTEVGFEAANRPDRTTAAAPPITTHGRIATRAGVRPRGYRSSFVPNRQAHGRGRKARWHRCRRGTSNVPKGHSRINVARYWAQPSHSCTGTRMQQTLPCIPSLATRNDHPLRRQA